MLEIYNESCFDLLAPPPKRPEDRKRLDIRQRRNGDVIVPDLLQQTVTSEQEVHTVMAAGGKNRALGSHDMNEHSSRSHLVLTVYVRAGCSNCCCCCFLVSTGLGRAAGDERKQGDRRNQQGQAALD